jgi:phage terminase small subunit
VTGPRVPTGLGADGKRLWRVTVADYDFAPHQLELLRLACEALDRAAAAAKIIRDVGVITVDRYGSPKAHPAVGIERDARTATARLLRELALEVDEQIADLRPPRIREVGR